MDIQKLLASCDLEPQIEPQSGQVFAIFKEGEAEFPLFVRLYDHGELFQLMAFFSAPIYDAHISAVARLLHLINKELDIPGFGFDEVGKVTFFRCMIPVKDGEVDMNLMKRYVASTRLACKTFHTSIEAVGRGLKNLDELLAEAETHVKNMKGR